MTSAGGHATQRVLMVTPPCGWTQRRFYRAILARLRRLIRGAQRGQPLPEPETRPDGIVIAPSGIVAHPLERLARGSLHPGR